VAEWDLQPVESAALSRRTLRADIGQVENWRRQTYNFPAVPLYSIASSASDIMLAGMVGPSALAALRWNGLHADGLLHRQVGGLCPPTFSGVADTEPLDWDAIPVKLLACVKAAIEALPDIQWERVLDDFERVDQLTYHIGQCSLQALSETLSSYTCEENKILILGKLTCAMLVTVAMCPAPCVYMSDSEPLDQFTKREGGSLEAICATRAV
jgi:hypothetical protein